MDIFRKIWLHSRLWIAVLGAAALGMGIWSFTPAPANAGGVPSLYAQYPYYPFRRATIRTIRRRELTRRPQLCTSTELCASGGPVGRQHRQTIEPTGAEPLAGGADEPATISILSISTAAALLMDVIVSAPTQVSAIQCKGSGRCCVHELPDWTHNAAPDRHTSGIPDLPEFISP